MRLGRAGVWVQRDSGLGEKGGFIGRRRDSRSLIRREEEV